MLIDSFPGVTGMVDSTELRKDLAGLIVRNADGTPRAGVFYRGTAPIGTARAADMKVDIAAFAAALVRTGPLFTANDGTVQSPTLPVPSSNQIIHVIYAKQMETAAPYSDPGGVDGPVFGFVSSDQGPTPDVAQAIGRVPTGGLPLISVQVPSTAVTTSSANVVIKDIAPFTATAGGVVVFRTAADLFLWTTSVPLQLAAVTSDATPANNVLWCRYPGGWAPAVPQPLEAVRPNTDQWAATTDTSLGLSLTLTVAAQARYLVEVELERGVPGNSAGSFGLKDALNGGAETDIIRVNDDNASNTLRNRVTVSRLLTLAAGTHLLSLYATQGVSGNKTVYAGTLIRATYVSPA